MFYGQEKIEKFCRTLITSMVSSAAVENKILLEEWWDKRFMTVEMLEKSVNKRIDARLDVLQHNVDSAVEKLTTLSMQLVEVATPKDDPSVQLIKENGQKHTKMMQEQAKASDTHREKMVAHAESNEEFNSKMLVAWDRVAEGIETLAHAAPQLEQVFENLAHAIDDFRKPPVVKPKKKKD
jgi:hypothetical protein